MHFRFLAEKHRREEKRCSWMRGMAGSPRPQNFFASGYTDQKVYIFVIILFGIYVLMHEMHELHIHNYIT